MQTTIWQRHRGPYTLQVMREAPKKKAKVTTENIAMGVDSSEVEELAQSFLTDPRDPTAIRIFVFSERENAHVTTYRKEDFQ